MGGIMEISVSLLIFMVGIIIAGRRGKAKKKKTGTEKKGQKSTSGSSLISKKQGGQSKVKTAKASARPNIPDQKRNKTTKKIPAHLALQEEAIKKYSPVGEISCTASQYADVLSKVGGCPADGRRPGTGGVSGYFLPLLWGSESGKEKFTGKAQLLFLQGAH